MEFVTIKHPKILKKIFHYLNWQDRLVMENVCSSWKVLLETSWHDVRVLKIADDYLKINNFPSIIFSSVDEKCNLIKKISKRCGNTVRVLECKCLSRSVANTVAENFSNLNELTLWYASEEYLEALF